MIRCAAFLVAVGLLTLALGGHSAPKTVFVVEAVRPDGLVLLQPALPVQFGATPSGATPAVHTVLRCRPVQEERRGTVDGQPRTLVESVLVCGGERYEVVGVLWP